MARKAKFATPDAVDMGGSSQQEPHPVLSGDDREAAFRAIGSAVMRARAEQNGAPLSDPKLIARMMAEIQAASAAHYAAKMRKGRGYSN